MFKTTHKLLQKNGHASSHSNDAEGREHRTSSDSSENFTGNLAADLDILKEIFLYPKNQDFIILPIYIKAFGADGVLIYLNGSVCVNTLTKDVIYPLMVDNIENKREDAAEDIIRKITTTKDVRKVSSVFDITNAIVKGSTILLIQGFEDAISISTSEFEHHSIEKPVNENNIKRPKEAFVESAQVNRSLVRKHLKYEKLVAESMEVGEKAKSDVFMMYVEGVTDSSLIENVKKRITSIKTNPLPNVSMLEQFIEERSFSLISTSLYTERPDRAAAFLNEGHIALMMDGSPACLIVPVTFWSFFQTPEDQYQRWPYGNFIRAVRLLAMLIALLTPAMYIAITNFHAEMVPSDLAVSIAAAWEMLPFPIIIEVLLMETSFELIREAGVRVPTTIGPTIEIVGALILGQAAVEANLVSPILVIIVSITGLSSFAIPENSLSYTIRIARFLMLAAGGFMGFLGISLMLTATFAYMLSITSFGVPFMSPVAPYYPSSNDTYTRAPLWKQWLMPLNISRLDPVRRGHRKRK